METIEFKKQYVDIVDLLKSEIALGPYRGSEVWGKIETLMNGVSNGTLVLIDLRKVKSWFNTAFCEPAFGPVFQALKEGKWLRKYVIFQMYDFHKWEFFQGVLKFFKIDVPRKESESKFASAKMCVKLTIGDEESINFVGNLNTNEKVILEVVNDLKQATAEKIIATVKESGLTPQIVVDELRSLVGKYFVIRHGDESDQGCRYYSFYNYLTKE